MSKLINFKSLIINKLLKLLPVPTSQRTTSVGFKFSIYLMYETTGISIIIGKSPVNQECNKVLKKNKIKKYNRIQSWKNPIAQALKYRSLLENNGSITQTQLANQLKISKVRLTQYLNLLKLDPSIISYLSSLQKLLEDCYISERLLRSIVKIEFPSLQKKKFFEIVNHLSN